MQLKKYPKSFRIRKNNRFIVFILFVVFVELLTDDK